MSVRVLNKGCAAGFWAVNGGGFAGTALFAAHEWGPLPWPALIVAGIGIGHSAWWTGLAYAHNGWVRGWWWRTTNHQCPGDDGDDGDFEPPPDEPDDDKTAGHDDTAIQIRSSYTLVA